MPATPRSERSSRTGCSKSRFATTALEGPIRAVTGWSGSKTGRPHSEGGSNSRVRPAAARLLSPRCRSARGHRRTLELLGEVLRGHHLGEHRVVELDRVLVLLGRRRRDAVRQRDDVVALLVARAHGRLDAAVRQEAAERDRRDAAAAQEEVEVGRGERVKAALALDHHVALLRRERVDDLGAPIALYERSGVYDTLEDAVGVEGKLAVARYVGDRRVDDRRPGGSRGLHQPARVLQHPGALHDVADRVVQGAALGGEVVLVLDQNDGGALRIEGHERLLMWGRGLR